MAATFPLAQAALADLLRIRSVRWAMDRFVETTMVGNGEPIEAELGPPMWRGDCETVPLTIDETDQLMARFDLLDGGQQAFYLHNPQRLGPQSDPTGATLGASVVKVKSVGADNKSLALKGLPAGYALTIGDYVAVDYGTPSRRGFFRLGASGIANGVGETAELELRPHIRPGITADCDAYLFKPAAKVVLIDGSADPSPVSTLHNVIRFSVRQTLRAG